MIEKKTQDKQLRLCNLMIKMIYYQSEFSSSFSTDTRLIHLLDHIKNKNPKCLFIEHMQYIESYGRLINNMFWTLPW